MFHVGGGTSISTSPPTFNSLRPCKSVGEENNRDNRDTDESIEEEERGVEDNIGDCVTDEEEDGAVTPAIYPFICIPFLAVFIITSLRIGGAGSNDL
jgi:hypothetical protein